MSLRLGLGGTITETPNAIIPFKCREYQKVNVSKR